MKHLILLAFVLPFCIGCFAQNPERFAREISKFENEVVSPNPEKPFWLFVGSSSIRMWDSMQNDLPDVYALNRGFGGSHMSDLIHFADELIFNFEPDKLFIYEGDNDIAAGKSPESILKKAKQLVEMIAKRLPNTEVYFLAAKPSISRWQLKPQYEQFNALLNSWCSQETALHFVDTWNSLLAKNGTLRKDIYIKDGLHLNAIGYKLWTAAILRAVRKELK